MSQQQQLVTFNVQNQLFTFPRQVLQDCKNSYFEVLLMEQFPIDTDEQGNILLERDAKIFKFVAEYLLDSQALHKYKPYTEEFLNKLLVEADYLQMDALNDYLVKQQQLVHLPKHQELSYKHEDTYISATGIMFDVQPLLCDIALKYFEICVQSYFNVPLVYYKEQSMNIDTFAPEAWNEIQFDAVPVANSLNAKLHISFAKKPIVLKESTVYAFHITNKQQGLIKYDHGDSCPEIVNNSTLKLDSARAVYFKPFAQEGEDFITFVGIVGYTLLK